MRLLEKVNKWRAEIHYIGDALSTQEPYFGKEQDVQYIVIYKFSPKKRGEEVKARLREECWRK